MSTNAIQVNGVRTASAPSAKLKPKEHGAYAMLAIPIVAAFLATGPSIVGLAVALAAVTGFIAHEPLLVAIGHRGQRAQQSTPGAMRRLALLLGTTVGCGVIALDRGTSSVRWSLVACAVLAIICFAIAIVGKHRTLAGQLLGVLGLSITCVPILLAGHMPVALAIETWGVWVMGFTSTTLAVHGVIAAQKRHSLRGYQVVVGLLTVGVFVLTAYAFTVPVGILPMLAMSWYLLLAPPPAKHLKRVGWTLVVGTVMSAIWISL